jgi:N-acylneuraminate cytidylyltransferase
MIDDRKVLAVIAARGGSKGLPNKALADLGGRPVIAWSVAAALASKLIDRTVISSDSPAIIEAACAAGCEAPFMRPAELATDEALVTDVVLHALSSLDEKYHYVVLLQGSSPLRATEDIDGCIRACHLTAAPAAVSVAAAPKHPRWMFSLKRDGRFKPFISNELWNDLQRRRQTFPEAYLPNGAIYVAPVDSFLRTHSFYFPETIGFKMPVERSVDIDTELDLVVARTLAGVGSAAAQ